MTITEQEYQAIVRRTSKSLAQFQEGGDAKQILSAIYCENLPGKSARQGTLMAQELLSWMGRFYAELDAALYGVYEDEDVYEGEEPWDIGLHSDTDEQSGMQERSVVNARLGTKMRQAVATMVIYTMMKNGELTEAPDATLPQVALAVCTEEAIYGFTVGIKEGYLAEEAVRKQRIGLRAVFLGLMTLAAGTVVSLSIGIALLGWIVPVLCSQYRAMYQMTVDNDLEEFTPIYMELDMPEESVLTLVHLEKEEMLPIRPNDKERQSSQEDELPVQEEEKQRLV